MGEHMNWGHIVLGAILYTEDGNKHATLQDIYCQMIGYSNDQLVKPYQTGII